MLTRITSLIHESLSVMQVMGPKSWFLPLGCGLSQAAAANPPSYIPAHELMQLTGWIISRTGLGNGPSHVGVLGAGCDATSLDDLAQAVPHSTW
jgi:hypothetical protein